MTTISPSAARPARLPTILPVGALIAGAAAMGASPIFVRLADVGPFASAFWRVALALPLLWGWARVEARCAKTATPNFRLDRPILFAGLLFAGDLFFWHLAILNTTVANATFLATAAPVWVVLGSGLFLGEAVGGGVLAGLGLCLAGAFALVGASYSFAPEHLRGDAFGLATSVFFGGYFLAVRKAGRQAGPGRITFMASLVTAAVLLPVALILDGRLLPSSVGGLATLVALAFVSHAGGQGLLAFALGHLPAAFSSLVIFLEGLVAALLGWMFLREAVSPLQALGGALILLGLFVARPRRPAPIKI